MSPPKSPIKTSGGKKRNRTASTSSPSTEGPVVRSGSRTIYTAGRPPWYDSQGQLKNAFVIGEYSPNPHLLPARKKWQISMIQVWKQAPHSPTPIMTATVHEGKTISMVSKYTCTCTIVYSGTREDTNHVNNHDNRATCTHVRYTSKVCDKYQGTLPQSLYIKRDTCILHAYQMFFLVCSNIAHHGFYKKLANFSAVSCVSQILPATLRVWGMFSWNFSCFKKSELFKILKTHCVLTGMNIILLELLLPCLLPSLSRISQSPLSSLPVQVSLGAARQARRRWRPGSSRPWMSSGSAYWAWIPSIRWHLYWKVFTVV